jgi:hypothetical protein
VTMLNDAQLSNRTLGPRCWAAVGLARVGDAPGAKAVFDPLMAKPEQPRPWPDRVLLARTCEVLGVPGVVLPQGADWVIQARLMQRALGAPSGPAQS